MTNLQRAAVKAFMIREHGLKAAKWNGNQLVGKRMEDKQWTTLLNDEAEVEAIYNKAVKGIKV